MAYEAAPIRRDSVITQAAQEICRFIEAERLSPGEALPPETALSQMLGISRDSLREALRVLHGLGHVEKAGRAPRGGHGQLARGQEHLRSDGSARSCPHCK